MHTEPRRVHAPTAIRPDFAHVLARVRGLRTQIEERALAAEKAKRVPAETMEALRDTAVFRLMQPARFGGSSTARRSWRRSASSSGAPAAAPDGAERWRSASAG